MAHIYITIPRSTGVDIFIKCIIHTYLGNYILYYKININNEYNLATHDLTSHSVNRHVSYLAEGPSTNYFEDVEVISLDAGLLHLPHQGLRCEHGREEQRTTCRMNGRYQVSKAEFYSMYPVGTSSKMSYSIC